MSLISLEEKIAFLNEQASTEKRLEEEQKAEDEKTLKTLLELIANIREKVASYKGAMTIFLLDEFICEGFRDEGDGFFLVHMRNSHSTHLATIDVGTTRARFAAGGRPREVIYWIEKL